MEKSRKRVLLTSNGDDVSQGIAFNLAKQGCRSITYTLFISSLYISHFIINLFNIFRLVLLGNATQLQSIATKITDSVFAEGVAVTDPVVHVVGLDMENQSESVFHDAVDKASKILGKLDAFVNCYSYEGKNNYTNVFLKFTIKNTHLGKLKFRGKNKII